jgi:peptidoglycan/xylan/chitin deacetylase (PgdA/CDA1 family)
MCVFVVILFAAAAIFVAPHAFRWPVTITLNDTQVQIPYGTTIGRAALNNMERGQLYGDILAVDGSVFEEFGGEAPSFEVDGQEIDASTPIHRARNFAVKRGADVNEPIAEELFDIEPEFIQRGYGPFKQVLNPGEVGVSARVFGELSEIEIDVEERIAPQPVEVQFSAFERNSRVVALTFDDGPHPVHTPALLEVLADEEVLATFFVTGLEVARHPNIAQQIVDAGHQIANHSYGHQDYRYLSYEEKRRDFQRSQDIIETSTGVRPNWVRPPYGLMNTSTFSLYGAEEMKIAHWTVDPADWRKPGARTIRERVVNQVRPGSVVLLHDGGGDREQTVRATRRIIRDLREDGFRFLTVEQLYERSNRE